MERRTDRRRHYVAERHCQVTPTQSQTFAMLALDRGASPEHLPPRTRRSLLQCGWIDRVSRILNDAGRDAMLRSSHFSAALKELDAAGDPDKALALRVIVTGSSLETRQRNRRRAAIASAAMRMAAR